MDNRFCVIMAGGTGNRFWPISRSDRPKQFIDLSNSGKTFLQLTYNRYAKIFPRENIIVVTLDRFADLTRSLLPDLPEENLLLEPFSRGTAPCVALASCVVRKRCQDAVMVVTPSDHIIRDEYIFQKTIQDSMDYVTENDVLMTLGVVPKSPETCFGYIQVVEGKDAYLADWPLKVKTFTEKPDEELAKVFFRTGEFFWNSGIFIWKASVIASQMRIYIPEVTSQFVGWEENIGTPTQKAFVERVYADCPKVSIDYGIMERTDKAWLFPAKFGWTDIGGWESLYWRHPYKDGSGNIVNTSHYITDSCSGNVMILKNKDKILAVKGLENYVVVDMEDALLICPKDDNAFSDFVAGLAMPEFEKYR